MKRIKLSGLHIWEVSLQYRSYFGSNCYITLLVATKTNSSVMAANKAINLVRRHRADWPQAKITKIENKGQLDA